MASHYNSNQQTTSKRSFISPKLASGTTCCVYHDEWGSLSSDDYTGDVIPTHLWITQQHLKHLGALHLFRDAYALHMGTAQWHNMWPRGRVLRRWQEDVDNPLSGCWQLTVRASGKQINSHTNNKWSKQATNTKKVKGQYRTVCLVHWSLDEHLRKRINAPVRGHVYDNTAKKKKNKCEWSLVS